MLKSRPNILVIQADQLAAQSLSLYGGKAKTPNLDNFSVGSTVFENFYCNFPLCGPSRASMLTGRLASRVGCFDNASELAASEPTFAHYLRRSGYRTCLSGKMHFIGPDQMHGFEKRLTAEIYPADFAWLPDWETGQLGWEPIRNAIENAGVCSWNMQIAFDEEATQKAIHQLYEYARKPEEAFFLFVSLSHPHHPFLTQPKYWEMYQEIDIPEPTTGRLDETQLDPHSLRCRKMIGLDKEDVPAKHARLARHGYYGSISYFDAKLGQILEALEIAGLAENTAIFVTADHGEMLGERGLWSKDCFFEWAMRVPLVVSMPGLKDTKRISQNASLIDLLPTFAEIAGERLEITGGDLEGQSLLSIIQGETEDWPDEVLAEYNADATREPLIMIRHGALKYIGADNDPEQLFNLQDDPQELNNLAALEKYSSELSQFRKRAAKLWDRQQLARRILVSQRSRFVVREAQKLGLQEAWDYIPKPDYNDTYVRSSNSHELIDRKVRIPAKGYTLPQNE